MRLLPKFLALSLLTALAPLTWLGVRWIHDMDRTLREASERGQRSLAGRAADTARGRLDSVVNALTLLERNLTDVGDTTRVLEAGMNAFPFLTDVWVYGPQRDRRASLHRLSPTEGPQDWAALRRMVEDGGFYAGPLERTLASHPRRLYAVPLRSERGGFRGFLVARVNLFTLSEALGGVDLGVGGRAFLLDREGELVAHSLKENLFATSFSGCAGWRRLHERLEEYPGFDGNDVLGVAVAGPEPGWRLIFEQPAAEALAPVRAMSRSVRRSVAAAGAFAVVLAGVLSVFIVRPLRQFLGAVRKMQGGEFDSLITVRSRDELGEIAQALRDAQAELKRRVRDSVLGRMARLIGHDMRQPVQGLRQSLEVIATHVHGADETATKHFRLVGEALDWMDDFIEDFLTVGRRRELNRRPTDVNALVKDALDKLKVLAGVRLVSRLSEPLPPAPIDPGEARRAVLNVIKNALEAAGPAGNVVVTTREAPEGVEIEVVDDGPGLAPEKRDRLFEEFTTKDTGSGLGLLVVKKVMDAHKGRIVIDAAPGGGTRAVLLFPRRPE